MCRVNYDVCSVHSLSQKSGDQMTKRRFKIDMALIKRCLKQLKNLVRFVEIEKKPTADTLWINDTKLSNNQ